MTEEFNYRKNPDFPHRYISPRVLAEYLQQNLSDYLSQVGSSFLGKPIYQLSLGTGKTKVLAWSQMHGNESNATHAMLDLLYSLNHQPELRQKLFEEIQLDFIFMLNPDGAEAWTRRNALGIDMNRDYLKLSSKEFPVLKNIAERGNYDYALNLHEQRTIFTTDAKHPATLSFLAPAENIEREVTETRKKAMAVITIINEKLSEQIPAQIGRYNDEFYPTSTGDNFTKMGLPTILYEGGHFPEDYLREGTRKFYTIALYEGLKAIGRLQGSTAGWEKYFEIPENRETHYDVIYRNVTLNTNFPCVLDIAVQYREKYEAGDPEITFEPVVMEVGDCGSKKGWKEIDCTNKKFICDTKFPKLDAVQNFEII